MLVEAQLNREKLIFDLFIIDYDLFCLAYAEHNQNLMNKLLVNIN